MTLYPETGLI